MGKQFEVLCNKQRKNVLGSYQRRELLKCVDDLTRHQCLRHSLPISKNTFVNGSSAWDVTNGSRAGWESDFSGRIDLREWLTRRHRLGVEWLASLRWILKVFDWIEGMSWEVTSYGRFLVLDDLQIVITLSATWQNLAKACNWMSKVVANSLTVDITRMTQSH